MSEDFESRMTIQSYAIAESLRHEMALLDIAISARKKQCEAALDPEVKRRLREYIAHLELAYSSAIYLLNHIESN
jgi:hypothetical protein